ncbi:MAG: hypothetical protein AMXMBFR33_10450 [Candidatus Xenobia bacterium]
MTDLTTELARIAQARLGAPGDPSINTSNLGAAAQRALGGLSPVSSNGPVHQSSSLPSSRPGLERPADNWSAPNLRWLGSESEREMPKEPGCSGGGCCEGPEKPKRGKRGRRSRRARAGRSRRARARRRTNRARRAA